MLFLFSRFLVTLSIFGVVLAVPLGIQYDKTTGLTAEEQANKGRLDAATTLANTQVTNMRLGLDKAKAGDPKAKALYEAAFGKQADIKTVDSTVTALQKGNIQAKVATHPFKAGEIAAVPWSKEGTKPWTPGPAQFSKQFHGAGTKPLDAAGRAGTLIHEATHQLSKTGDDINKSGKIIKPYDGTSKPTGDTGYTSNHNMHKTVKEVNADKAFTNVRDSAPNMHDNAESYAVFASLCSQPGALRRRDVRLYNRALLSGDHEQLHHLARRNSCKLPKDYFAKKAAAKKAAAAKAAPGVKPSPNSKVAATKASKSTPKGGSAARLSKSTVPKSSKASLRGNRQTTKGGVRTTKKGVKASTAARGAKALRKGANAGRLAKTKAVKGAKRPVRSSRTAQKGNKQAAKSTRRPVRGAPRKGSPKVAAVRGAKPARSNRQRTTASKSSQAQRAAPRRSSSKVAAVPSVKLPQAPAAVKSRKH